MQFSVASFPLDLNILNTLSQLQTFNKMPSTQLRIYYAPKNYVFKS
jgi:hypothetical protein